MRSYTCTYLLPALEFGTVFSGLEAVVTHAEIVEFLYERFVEIAVDFPHIGNGRLSPFPLVRSTLTVEENLKLIETVASLT